MIEPHQETSPATIHPIAWWLLGVVLGIKGYHEMHEEIEAELESVNSPFGQVWHIIWLITLPPKKSLVVKSIEGVSSEKPINSDQPMLVDPRNPELKITGKRVRRSGTATLDDLTKLLNDLDTEGDKTKITRTGKRVRKADAEITIVGRKSMY